MVKKGVFGVIGFFFVMGIFLLSSVSAAQCAVVSGSCGGSYPYGPIMKLSGTSNAHASTASGSSYPYSLCCDFPGVVGDCTNYDGSSSLILKLASTSNAHAQLRTQSGYGTNICYAPQGNNKLTCSGGPVAMVSLTSSTNAHIGAYGVHGTSVSCTYTEEPSEECGNGVVETGEDCEVGQTRSCTLDGYDYGTETCHTGTCTWITSSCGNYVCGNSNCEGDEECDDGDSGGDGCDAYCNIESGWSCTCTSSGSTCTRLCDLTSVSWSTTGPVNAGTSVSFTVNNNGQCNGLQLAFQIYDYDSGSGDELAYTNPSPVTISGSSTTRSWIAEAPDRNGEVDPEYYIYSYITQDSGINVNSGSARLSVVIPSSCGNGYCDSGETCSSCPDDCPCTPPLTCQSGSCVAPCTLNSASWSTTNAVDGAWVSLNVGASNCAGQTMTFEVWEDDTVGDDPVQINPGSVIIGSQTPYWQAEWPGYGDGEETPEYYFIAEIPALSLSIQSSTSSSYELHVTENFGSCGDSSCVGSETCDDGGTSSGDGCSSSCQEEIGYSCTCNSGVVSTCTNYCGNGNVDTAYGEECDVPDMGSGTCESEYGTGWTGNLGCSNCQYTQGTCTAPPECVFSSATWSGTSNCQGAGGGEKCVEDGDSVYLNVQTANCDNGEAVEFTVMEDDSVGDDNVNINPSNGLINNNVVSVSWIAEYHDDTGIGEDGNPPEYYFIADFADISGQIQSSAPLLEVYQSGELACLGISLCDHYTDQTSCEDDLCDTGVASNPGVGCGITFYEDSRCSEVTTCGCAWDGFSCIPDWNSSLSCGVCGNGVLDYGEECDDFNTDSGDGCSSECIFEVGISPPCPVGLTLCEDNTCSLNCEHTDEGNAFCDNDDNCETGEGCSCEDCGDEPDTCAGGLVCSFEDNACCLMESDGICTPACSFSDPDCGGSNAVCGNGLEETGEQCDDGDTDNGDGCDSNCNYEILGPGVPCPEGTILCNDGTCSLNCDFTDEGIGDCSDGDCCADGLLYSSVDVACCNYVGDLICNPYCAFSDPDCGGDVFLSGMSGIGQCVYTKDSEDDCADGFLTRDYSSLWVWNPDNIFDENPVSGDENYVLGSDGKWHYDPLDLSGLRKSDSCQSISDELICPAQIQLPFAGVYSLLVAIGLISLIYLIIIFRRR